MRKPQTWRLKLLHINIRKHKKSYSINSWTLEQRKSQNITRTLDKNYKERSNNTQKLDKIKNIQIIRVFYMENQEPSY